MTRILLRLLLFGSTLLVGCSSVTDASSVEPYAAFVGDDVELPQAMKVWDQLISFKISVMVEVRSIRLSHL